VFKSFFIDEIPDQPNVERINEILLEKALDGQKLEINGIPLKKEVLDMQMPETTKLVKEIKNLPYNITPFRWSVLKYKKGHFELNETELKKIKIKECSLFAENQTELNRYNQVKKIIDALNELFESGTLAKDYKHKFADGNVLRVYEGKFIPVESYIKQGVITNKIYLTHSKTPDLKNTPVSKITEGSRKNAAIAAQLIHSDSELKTY